VYTRDTYERIQNMAKHSEDQRAAGAADNTRAVYIRHQRCADSIDHIIYTEHHSSMDPTVRSGAVGRRSLGTSGTRCEL
jgi:hypothetical protein